MTNAIKIHASETILVYAWKDNFLLRVNNDKIDQNVVQLDQQQHEYLTEITIDYLDKIATLFKVENDEL